MVKLFTKVITMMLLWYPPEGFTKVGGYNPKPYRVEGTIYTVTGKTIKYNVHIFVCQILDRMA